MNREAKSTEPEVNITNSDQKAKVAFQLLQKDTEAQ